MNNEKQIEEIELTEVDILANDLNQHCADLAENYCGGLTCLSCLAHALTEKGYRKSTELAEEIFAEIDEIIEKNRYKSYLPNSCLWSYSYLIGEIINGVAELKKKYTEEGK